MNLRKSLVQAAAVLALSTVLIGGVFAQGTSTSSAPDAPKAGKGTKKPKTMRSPAIVTAVNKLTLTEDQKTKITALVDTYKAEVAKLRESSDAADQTKLKTGALTKKLREDITALLTDEQKSQLKANADKAKADKKAKKDPAA